jgi:hypothetical protein
MKIKDILISGTAGTTFMTLFSYGISALDNENYSEPERLGQLARGLLPVLSKRENQVIGWSAHYGVGLLFATAYAKLWEKRKLKPTFVNNFMLGAASGMAAVAIWKATFSAHPLPPRMSFDKYYLQLVPAHIVFAVFAGLGYSLLNRPGDINENESTFEPLRHVPWVETEDY